MNNKRKYTIPNKCYDQELTIITKRNMCEIIYTGVKFNPRLLKVSFIVWKKQQNLSTHQTIQVHKDIYQNLTRQGSPFYW